MAFVICQNSIESLLLYVGPAKNPRNYGLYRDPNYALVFETRGEAKEYQVNFANLSGSVLTKEEAIQKWDELKANGFFDGERPGVDPELVKKIEVTGDTARNRENVATWWLERWAVNANIPYQTHNAAYDCALRVFKFVQFTGYSPETSQSSCRLRFREFVNAERLAILKAELLTIIPKIKPVEQKISFKTGVGRPALVGKFKQIVVSGDMYYCILISDQDYYFISRAPISTTFKVQFESKDFDDFVQKLVDKMNLTLDPEEV